MPEGVVNDFETVEVDEQHCPTNAVALDPCDQPLELAHETAPVRQVDQRIPMRQLVKLLDALLKPRDLGPQQTDLLDQPFPIIDVDHDVGHLIRHCP